jgi:quercetin dioxygenase-like cupin family protein
MRSED